MPSEKLIIKNKRGLHARASAKFMTCARGFEADITVRHEDMCVPGTSIMGLMMLAAAPGCEIEIKTEGNDADAALEALKELVESKFGED